LCLSWEDHCQIVRKRGFAGSAVDQWEEKYHKQHSKLQARLVPNTSQRPALSTCSKNKIDMTPGEIRRRDQIVPLFTNINKDTMKKTLSTLTGFNNRNYDSAYGLEAAQWIQKTVCDMVMRDTRDGVYAQGFSTI
jgi:hypothetical protein